MWIISNHELHLKIFLFYIESILDLQYDGSSGDDSYDGSGVDDIARGVVM